MRILSFIFLFFITLFGEVIAPNEAFIVDTNTSESEISLNFRVADEIYIYKDEIKIFIDNAEVSALLNLPEPKEYKNHQIYDGNFSIALPMGLVLANAKDNKNFQILVKFLGCTVGGFCYEPQNRGFALNKSGKSYEISALKNPGAGISGQNLEQNSPAQNSGNFGSNLSQSQILEIFENKSFFMTLILFFGFGVLLSLTPCIYPLIPILSSIIVAKTASKPSVKLSLIVSVIYVLGMASSYAVLGAGVAVLGENLQGILQNKIALIITAAIFVALAFSLFGVYEIRLPGRLQNFLSAKSDARSGFVGVFLMGAISSLMVSPCISAPLSAALIYIANSANIALGASALFALGLGSGVLLIIIGLGGALPRPGEWMEVVPKIFGFLLLFMAVWIVRFIIGENLALLFYAILCALMAGVLGLFDARANALKRALALLTLVYSVLLLIGFASGARDFTKPLSEISAQKGVAAQKGVMTQSAKNGERFIFVRDLGELREMIKGSQKPVIVDFWAQWCKNCEESEAAFGDESLAEILSNFTLAKVDLTQNSPQMSEIKKEFGIMGPPAILFFKNGSELENLRQIGSLNSAKLAQILLQI
ncbi:MULTISPECIES: protein-disulfide reductase DsbD [unclassified Campylobacter]|uniref:protein-disulfide reductase DsbD n=1 Tax=unclassified Campylobacter TaxID=2593542 RepID=UPI0022E9E7C9|nr:MULTISPECIES: protein-disulfide reductase DsbD [unclassified Campylobacter]MDA3054175.1 protein-disulfide reductase DsbD [Campylobacter sp. VBCF_07 NA4]MDA3060866.1 protein-disulfide reductase DsbD [Campylobacter sp. VBCF_02 NA5]MDA3070379.1 protein-disulfide reductase DsbD [Campylobacter sp. VBCF_08 NA3]WBR53689.1 protein-disulfide reductase DsbD [Campylobacter sp. VBCF_01 NA2]